MPAQGLPPSGPSPGVAKMTPGRYVGARPAADAPSSAATNAATSATILKQAAAATAEASSGPLPAGDAAAAILRSAPHLPPLSAADQLRRTSAAASVALLLDSLVTAESGPGRGDGPSSGTFAVPEHHLVGIRFYIGDRPLADLEKFISDGDALRQAVETLVSTLAADEAADTLAEAVREADESATFRAGLPDMLRGVFRGIIAAEHLDDVISDLEQHSGIRQLVRDQARLLATGREYELQLIAAAATVARAPPRQPLAAAGAATARTPLVAAGAATARAPLTKAGTNGRPPVALPARPAAVVGAPAAAPARATGRGGSPPGPLEASRTGALRVSAPPFLLPALVGGSFNALVATDAQGSEGGADGPPAGESLAAAPK